MNNLLLMLRIVNIATVIASYCQIFNGKLVASY